MKLYVKTLVGKSYTIEVSADFTIENVKSTISYQTTIPINQQRLMYNGKTLVDNRTIADYRIAPDSTLTLIMEL